MTGAGGFDRKKVDAWRSAMLALESGRLIGLSRNYPGEARAAQEKRPSYDKDDLVQRLESFLKRPETGREAAALLDRMDTLVIGSLLVAGPMPEAALKALFLGELPLADLGMRLANLEDRLLVYADGETGGGRIEVNPFVAGSLAEACAEAETLFGLEEGTRPGPSDGSRPSLRRMALGLVAFLTDHPAALRKDGSVSSRAMAALSRMSPGAEESRMSAVLRALASTGYVETGRTEWRVDTDGLERMFAESWDDLPWRLALVLAGGNPAGAPDLSAWMRPFMSRGFVFSRAGLQRFLRLSLWKSGRDEDEGALVSAFADLGLLVETGDGLACVPQEDESPLRTGEGPVLVAEESGALHLMPGAGLDDRMFLMAVARPVSLAVVWGFELDRKSARRAFARGFGAGAILGTLGEMTGREFPQTLSFSLKSWEEDYRRIRLYRGSFLVVEPGLATILEKTGAAEDLDAEAIAPGLYFLGGSAHERIDAVLEPLGIEPPPAIRASRRHSTAGAAPGGASPAGIADAGAAPAGTFAVWAGRPGTSTGLQTGMAPSMQTGMEAGPQPGPAVQRDADRPRGNGPNGARNRGAAPSGEGIPLRFGNPESHAAPRRTAVPPGPVPAILAALGGMGLDPAFRATMEERIARKLILSPDHLKRLVDSSKLADSAQRAAPSDRHAALAGAHDLKAGAMDYQGKIRLVRLAMKSPLDRLEVRWVPAGETSRLVSLRPVSLEKTGTGYTLEAEDLATGSPLRIGIGAMSSVRLVRASYFGETK